MHLVGGGNVCQACSHCGCSLSFLWPWGMSYLARLNVRRTSWCIIWWVFLFFTFLGPHTPVAYGGSQARGRIGIRAVAANLHHSHSNARFLTHWARPGIKPTSSWRLCQILNPEPHCNSRSYVFENGHRELCQGTKFINSQQVQPYLAWNRESTNSTPCYSFWLWFTAAT